MNILKEQENKNVSTTFNPCDICHYDGSLHCPEKDDTPIDFKTLTKESIHDRIVKGETEIRPLTCKSLLIKEDTTIPQLADYLTSNVIYKTMMDNDKIYYYLDGIYNPDGEIQVKTKLEKHFPLIKTHMVNETLEKVRRRTYTNRSEFDNEEHLMAIQNGILDLKTGEVNPFTPNYMTLTKLPIEYDKNVDCPENKRFFASNCHPDFVQTLIEMSAYGLIKNYKHHKFMVIQGDTDCGKTTYVKLLNVFYGQENIEALGLQQLLEEPFVRHKLYGKLLNIGDDLPKKILKFLGILTQLTGGSPMTHNVKNSNNLMKFVNISKQIFTCNIVPKTDDQLDAFYNRALLIPFITQFRSGDPRRDPELIDKLTTSEEISGLLNLFIKALKDIEERGYIYYPYTIEETKDYWLKSSDPLYALVEEHIEFESTAKLSKSDLYDKYRDWSIENKLAVKQSNIFSREIKKYLKGVKDGVTTIKGKNTRVWEGIRLKETEPFIEDDEQITLDEEN